MVENFLACIIKMVLKRLLARRTIRRSSINSNLDSFANSSMLLVIIWTHSLTPSLFLTLSSFVGQTFETTTLVTMQSANQRNSTPFPNMKNVEKVVTYAFSISTYTNTLKSMHRHRHTFDGTFDQLRFESWIWSFVVVATAGWQRNQFL